MNKLSCGTRATAPKCLCASPYAKLIGTLDGFFPDYGHHSEGEMCGLWMHPIKVLDGFWFRFRDEAADNVDTWILADEYEVTPLGNRFEYHGGLGHTRVTITREQLAPEDTPGIMVRYRLVNHDSAPRNVEAEWLARTDLYPVWFSLDSNSYEDGQDTGAWDAETQIFLAKDEKNPWYVAIHPQEAPSRVRVCNDLFGPQRTKGKGTGVSFVYDMTLAGHEERTLTFFVTGSAESSVACENRLNQLMGNTHAAQTKQAHADAVLAASALTTGDEAFDKAWAWTKLNTDWLDINADAYGRGIAAGLPEYPWWFGCDSCYAIQGLLAIGRYDMARDTLKLLADYSRRVNGNGRIVHEITTFGICSNPGNTQETAHYVTAVWHYWRWTGDRSFVDEVMPLLRQSMAWLTEQDKDGDTFPDGYGIIEIQGLNAEMIDSIVYTTQAWSCYGELCTLVGDEAEAARARNTYRRHADALNSAMWDDELGTYCDAYASPDFVCSRRREILGRYRDKSEEAYHQFDNMLARKQGAASEEVGFYINGNWTIATPMETGEAPEDKARRALAFLNTPSFVGEWGIYLNALNRDAIMTISTGVVAVAQARYGYAERAMSLLQRMTATFGAFTPGTICEMSPDYGCFCQAWTAYALFVPVVRHIFGIQPEAGENCVLLSLCMPDCWTDVRLERVRVLDGELTVRYLRGAHGYQLTLSGNNVPSLRVKIRDGEVAVSDCVSTVSEGCVCVSLPAGGEIHLTITQSSKCAKESTTC